MKLRVLTIFLLICISVSAQDNNQLRGFVNKNHVAIMAVHKYISKNQSGGDLSALKQILQHQLLSVKLYNSDNSASFYYALVARKESLNFLKAHTKNSTQYFEMTEIENSFKSQAPASPITLSQKELNTINNAELLNAESLQQFNLTIQ